MNIFRRFRRWLIDKYLPAYVTAANREDIAALCKEVSLLKIELKIERAYSTGLERVSKGRIIIHTGKEG